MRYRVVSLAFVVVLLFAFSSWPARAQDTTGTIVGTVTDSQGGVIPGAEVKAVHLDTNLSRIALTDETGHFLVQFLPVGRYRVEVTFPGFKTFVHDGIVVELNRSDRVDPVMEPGEVTQSITVSGDAPLVETSNAAVGQTVNSVDIANLPLVNRNVYDLLDLTPGVDNQRTSNVFGGPSQETSVNGAANAGGGTVNYMLDGGSNTVGLRNTGGLMPSPEAIQEFQVATNSFSAEHGRFSGGVVNMITKSGTNNFHGSLFEAVRNDALNANRWSPSGSGLKDMQRRNMFGGTVGGPIKRDRTFFFFSYDGLRQRGTRFTTTADRMPPTQLERAGDFSQSAEKPRDPLTGQAFPGDKIPLSRFDPVAKRILDEYIPLPNMPDGTYEGQAPVPTNSDTFQTKISHLLTAAHQLEGSFMYSTYKDVEPFRGSFTNWVSRDFTSRQTNISVADTWTISPTIINVFRASYLRAAEGRLNFPEKDLGDLGSTFRIQGPKSLPRINVKGRFSMDVAIFGPFAGDNNYQLKELFSMTRGRHSLKMGGELQLQKIIHDTTLDNYSIFTFNRTNTGGTRNSLADFLLGLPLTFKQDSPVTKIDNAWFTGGFLQDDFKIHPRLTLNLGLRYDLLLPYKDPLDRKVTYVPGRQSQVVPKALPGMLFPGDPGVARGIVEADTNNIMPRLGLAWDPFGDGKTAVRAGAGLFYGTTSGNMWNTTADNQPFTTRQEYTDPGTLADPYAKIPGGNPFPYIYDKASPRFTYPVTISGPSLDFQIPYVYQFNLTVDRQVLTDLRIGAAYVGSMGHHWFFDHEQNRPIWNPSATSKNQEARRPIMPGVYKTINVLKSILNNNYHGLQVTAEKRFSAGFQFRGFYTWSKSMDDADLQGDLRGGAQNLNDIKADRARTSNDRRHSLSMAGIWMPNYFGKLPVPVRAVLQGWTMSAIVRAGSGQGFTVGNGEDRNYDGSNERANLVGNPRLDPNRPRAEVVQQWFNTAAFQPTSNTNGEYGNSGRNILDGPGYRYVDMAIFRDFGLKEELKLQFRFESNNVFNLVNLNNPTDSLSNTNIGRILNAGGMREVQLGLRVIF
ncbi:MAG: TonB-dependent receptor [Acidobacteria bacterium]|nr:MAG: TonB-dependent receptor [Acidobacteriota bacterium]